MPAGSSSLSPASTPGPTTAASAISPLRRGTVAAAQHPEVAAADIFGLRGRFGSRRADGSQHLGGSMGGKAADHDLQLVRREGVDAGCRGAQLQQLQRVTAPGGQVELAPVDEL